MILILLYRFSESPESLLGYQLCWKLVKEGHHLYVTTTSTGGWLKAEIQKAEQLTEDSEGSITLLTPKCREYEQPSPEWIANFHKQYFGYLSEHTEIDVVIGTLPGTTITGIELKEDLNCKLILLATTKIGAGKGELTQEVISSVLGADEVWSVGSDIYTHYQSMFQEHSILQDEAHKEILLQPSTGGTPFWERHSTGRKFVSVWSMPTLFFHKGRKQYSHGSNLQSFSTFCAALGQINANAKRSMDKLQLNVHGLQFKDQLIQQIQGQTKSGAVKITPLSAITSIDNLPLKHCRAFIVPDYVEESFNFLALSAIWLGIPTLVSSQSSVGKFLLRLQYSEKYKTVVNLTGDIEHDTHAWIEKINREILGHEAHSIRWARGLAEHLHTKRHLWALDPSPSDVFYSKRKSSDSSIHSYATAPEGPVNPKIVSKVVNWQKSNFLQEPTRPQQIRTRNYTGASQTSSSSNITPSSSVSSLSIDQNTIELRECATHRGKTVDLFCQTCRHFICHACRLSHSDHSVLGVQEERERLTSFLHDWKRQAKEAERKKIEVLRCIDLVESSSLKAGEQMTEQYNFVKGELDVVYSREIEKVYTLKQDQLQKLRNEISDLEEIDMNWQIVEQSGKRLLEQVATSNFMSNSSSFMSENEPRKLRGENEAIIRRLQYRPPTVAPEDFRTYLQEFLLGFFIDPMSNEHGPRLTRGHFKGSMQSIVSVGGDSFATESARSRLSYIEREMQSVAEEHEEELTKSTLISPNLAIEMVSKTSLKHFKGTKLLTFFSALFQGNSMWICGWNKNVLGNNDAVLLTVEVPSYNVLLKEKKKGSPCRITNNYVFS